MVLLSDLSDLSDLLDLSDILMMDRRTRFVGVWVSEVYGLLVSGGLEVH